MNKRGFSKYGSAFFELLFLRFYPTRIDEIKLIPRILVYFTAITLFYIPVLAGAVMLSINYLDNMLLFIVLFFLHIIAKFIRVYSEKVQLRYNTIKNEKGFFRKIFLITEYALFMWIVYLIYPISCILFPFGVMLSFYERFFNIQFFTNILTANIDDFIFYGSIVSYFLFIFFGNYKKIMTGALPSYLVLYAVLTGISGLIDNMFRLYVPDDIQFHLTTLSAIVSEIFSRSNQALRFSSSALMFLSAIRSLYTNCGLSEGLPGPAAELSDTSEHMAAPHSD